jgi:hypothetical protein
LFISANGRMIAGLPEAAIACARPIRCASPFPSAIALGVNVRPRPSGMKRDMRSLAELVQEELVLGSPGAPLIPAEEDQPGLGVLAGQAVEASGVAVGTDRNGGLGGDRQQTNCDEGAGGEANPHHRRTVQTLRITVNPWTLRSSNEP